MKYFALDKTDNKSSLKDKTNFKKGYQFSKKVTITLYNNFLIKTILDMKFSAAFNKLLKVYTTIQDDDEEGVNELLIKSDTLKSIIMQKYYPYIGKSRTKQYLLKLENFENTLSKKITKKSRVRWPYSTKYASLFFYTNGVRW